MAISPGILTLVLFAAGALLLVGELFLPTQGILGLLGVISIGTGVGVGFSMNQWLGLTLMLATLAATPIAITIALNVYPKTPIGRRMVLPTVNSVAQQLPVVSGAVGIAVTALRPAGECEFGPHRVEASSELGPISPGQRVQIIRVEPNRAIVRALV